MPAVNPQLSKCQLKDSFITEQKGLKGHEQTVFPGVNLHVINLPAENPVIADVVNSESKMEFAFVLNGKARASILSGSPELIELSEQSAITHFLPNMHVKFEATSSSCIRMMGIQVETQVLRNMLHEEKYICPALERSLEEGSCEHFIQSGNMTPAQSVIVNQILTCQFCGQARSLFMQSKVLELMAHQIHLFTGISQRSRSDYLSVSDEERIRSARDILKSRMADAPTLSELAPLVGLSVSKLKKGFKLVYGKTSYTCFHEDRMETAYALLSERQMNVSEVAWEIGYINVGHFSTAFRKYFGIRPKEFQLRYI